MHTIIISIALSLLCSLNIMAQKVYEYDDVKEQTESLEELKKAVEDNPSSASAKYNLALHFYNKGVTYLETMGDDKTFEENYEIQEMVMLNFAKALPYATEAHLLDESEIQTVRMLSGIHFGLNNMEMHEQFEKLLAELSE